MESNDIWSKYVQGTKTLYYSRKLRFHDMFAQQYKTLFGLDKRKNIKILEIGCGPGALASALHRWYPNAEITAVDLDSEFIRFARGMNVEFSLWKEILHRCLLRITVLMWSFPIP